MLDTHIVVIAGSIREANTFGEKHGIRIKYVDEPRRLFGTDGFRRSVIVMRSAYTLPNIDSIMREVALRGYGVINV